MQIQKIINIKSLCIVSIAFCLSSCKFLEPTIGDFNVKNMEPKSEQEFIVEVAVEVDNPNTFNIWLKKGKMDILMGNDKMGTLNTVGKVVLKKKTKDYYIITCLAKLDPGSALLGMLTGIGGNKNKPVTFKGSIHAGVFIFYQTFDIEFDDRLPSMNLFGN